MLGNSLRIPEVSFPREELEAVDDEVLEVWQSIGAAIDKHYSGDLVPFNSGYIDDLKLQDAIAYYKARTGRLVIPAGVEGDELKDQLEFAESINQDRARLKILEEIQRLKSGGIRKGLFILKDKRLVFWRLKNVDSSWFSTASTVLLMDATAMEDMRFYDEIFGLNFTLHMDDQGRAALPPSPIVTTVMVRGAPVTKARRENEKNKVDMRRFHETVSHEFDGKNLAVMQSGFELFEEDERPDNLDIRSAGFAMGSNEWERADTVTWMAQPDPGPREFERQAALFGMLDKQIVPAKGKRAWYKVERKPMRVREGGAVFVDHFSHPCGAVNLLREHSVHGRIYQAIGRGRATRRDETCPLTIFACTNETVSYTHLRAPRDS